MAAAGLADLAAYQGKYAEAARILTQGAAADEAAKMDDNAARKYAALGKSRNCRETTRRRSLTLGKALAHQSVDSD